MTYEYNAQVVRWIDGDTVELQVDLGFHLRYNDHFRLYGVDTPERGRPLAAEAKALAMSMAPVGAPVHIQTSKADKYGRWLAVVWPDTDKSINDALVEEKLAVAYFGGTK